MAAPAFPATWLAGYIPDLPTPFDESGAVDLATLAKLCERQIDARVPAIVVCETAGEASTLTPVEQQRIVGVAVEVARRRVRVIAGAGSNSTSHAIELTRRAERAGADAVLSVVPYYNRPMQAGIHAHFRAIAEATNLPIILHDIPSRTIRELADDTLARLAEAEQFIGLRDATADVARPMRLRPLLPSGFRLLSGDDATALAYFANGGDGSISTISNVAPDLCLAMYSSSRQGRLQSARYVQHRLAPLTSALSRENPAALKYALCLLGFMSPATRLPIVELTDAAKAEVAGAIAAIGEDLAGPGESRRRSHEDAAAKS
ncbi:4-hydroxy-tetrahydrodipicolinate synthase [Bradyrhizobium lablabi]|uniref:4-hydroxy-tetrahydrodipicolinate synthase n=1 Tax=Bradyrhizobium lablabi TaxID=722472 RepID=A0A1M7DJ51_9BRAD|nr:4-hydroxy-tetrahydrodipicolinate synthase [Bradyrhizobium lablabi]SHL79428.1 4-hydroxy-tetrahydrodipicolinate synthase [Bradyrhizobium lablabi]